MRTSTEITRKPYGVESYCLAVGFPRRLGVERVTIHPNVSEQTACSFFLLGPFAVVDRQGTVITPKAQKTCAMLAMLILSPRATRTRVWIRDKLWSDRSEEQGAASLRQALLEARRSLGDLGPEVILADKKSISLDLTKITLDTDSLLSGEYHLTSDREQLERALNEDLLEGMDIRDPEFEDWLTLERQVWQRRVTQQLESEKKEGAIGLYPVTEDATQASSKQTQAVTSNFTGTDGPSIGVLPFRVADDSVHEYICEGLADDIILALSNNHWLNVISRNSSFAYQYEATNSKMVANDLKVNYIVGGTVKVLNSVITITVTLESVTSNCIIWSESFSVEMTEIMNLQERIATNVTAHLLQELGKHEQVRAYESRIDDLTTWQLVHRGHWHMARRTSTGVAQARTLYQRALDRDEYQSDALVALAWWHFWKAWSEHGTGETDYDLDQSMRLCRRALLMDRSDGRVHAYLGAIAIMRNQASAAVSFFDEAIRLNPSLSFAYSSRGSANLLLGKPELAPTDILNALALNPADYYRFHSLSELAAAYFFSADLDRAIKAAESSSFLAPRYWYARLIKIACLISRGNAGDRQVAVKEKAEISNRDIKVSDEKIRAIPFINRQYNQRLIEIYNEV